MKRNDTWQAIVLMYFAVAKAAFLLRTGGVAAPTAVHVLDARLSSAPSNSAFLTM